MKRLLRIIVLLIVVGTVTTLPIMQKLDNNEIVECYCSARYQHNVSDYKDCKKLTPNQLIKKLTADEQNKYDLEVPKITLKALN